MKKYKWNKVSGEGNYQGLRGLYLKEFKHSSLVDVKKDYKKVIGVLRGGIVEYAKEAGKDAAVHSILVEGVLYDERRMDMLNLPFPIC